MPGAAPMNPHSSHSSPRARWTLTLGALGVVYGDIGTSPLYALRECLTHGGHGITKSLDVLGPTSLMLWSFIIIVSIKYLTLLCRATNQGEGGVFALLSLLRLSGSDSNDKNKTAGVRQVGWLGLLAILGAALLYGDGVITPAISVLSAVEGLKEINPDFSQFVIPAALVIIIGLFMVQRHGTHRIGASFGPVMLVWFSVLAIMGVMNIVKHPDALAAFSPHYGFHFLFTHGWNGMVIMGSVLLCVTGCEALYADIGHFGASPMQRSWFFLAGPALMLNYLGQAALVLHNPEAIHQPFFRMVPESWLIPLVILATMATIIASQAMITGVFSLTQQAVQLGYLPRLKIKHTNPDIRGQIYLPQINIVLCLACIGLVIGFGGSSPLAAAYGLTVSANMVLTTLLFMGVMLKVWHWRPWIVYTLVTIFLSWELSFLTGSLSKLFHGAWLPVLTTMALWMLMKTWKEGRAYLWESSRRGLLPIEHLVHELDEKRIPRVRGTGVFLSASADGMPLVLLHHLKHNKALHERVVLLTVVFLEVPHAAPGQRAESIMLRDDMHRLVLRYGFSESPDVMKDLCHFFSLKKRHELSAISFYQARELLLTDGKCKMAKWRKHLFILLARMARPATGYFDLPPRQVIELGLQMAL